jgi:hypothetical protein
MQRAPRAVAPVAVALVAALGAACGEGARQATDRAAGAARAEMSVGERYPTLENVRPIPTAPRTYDFMVMQRAPYATPSRYAAGWRVLAPNGDTLAVKRLTRPYLGGGSFWRRQVGVRVPRGVRRVQLGARDSRNGYGGRRLTVTLP